MNIIADLPVWLQWLITFTALFTTDVCWAYYISRVNSGNALHSSKWAVLLFLTGSVGVIGYVSNPWLLIPAALGCFAGTYVAVILDKKK